MDPVERLRDDREHGAAELLAMALDALASAAEAGEDVPALAHRLEDARPTMVPVGNGVRLALERYGAHHDPGAILAVKAEAADARDRAARAAARLLAGQRVVTLSRSSTVHRALVQADASVTVLASEPPGEGRDAADALDDAGLDARCVPDAAARRVLDDADACLVGADAVLGDGSVVNKLGSWTLAACAADAGVPFHVVADRFKRTGATRLPYDRDLFEGVPARLVTGIIP